jgi:simple sugar transport system substrate-binding protein
LYVAKAKAVLNGTWKKENLWLGIAEGATDLAPINDAVPADVKAMVAEKKAALKAGTMRVFKGPINDQSGLEKVSKDDSMTDGALLGFDWFIEGVSGTLPKS